MEVVGARAPRVERHLRCTVSSATVARQWECAGDSPVGR